MKTVGDLLEQLSELVDAIGDAEASAAQRYHHIKERQTATSTDVAYLAQNVGVLKDRCEAFLDQLDDFDYMDELAQNS